MSPCCWAHIYLSSLPHDYFHYVSSGIADEKSGQYQLIELFCLLCCLVSGRCLLLCDNMGYTNLHTLHLPHCYTHSSPQTSLSLVFQSFSFQASSKTAKPLPMTQESMCILSSSYFSPKQMTRYSAPSSVLWEDFPSPLSSRTTSECGYNAVIHF